MGFVTIDVSWIRNHHNVQWCVSDACANISEKKNILTYKFTLFCFTIKLYFKTTIDFKNAIHMMHVVLNCDLYTIYMYCFSVFVFWNHTTCIL